MTEAEEALAALARDLVEEIAAGRVLELAQSSVDTVLAQQTAVPLPPPKKGAAAVHPQLGGHLLTLPGDSISGHAHAHVPRPLPPPDQKDLALATAKQLLSMHDQAESDRLDTDAAAAAAARTGIPQPGDYAPLDDDQYAAHVTRAHQLVAAHLAAGHATSKTETLDGHGQIWKPERAAVHNEIVRQLADQATGVPSERRSLVVGGLGGAGKTTTLQQIPGSARHAVISTDDIAQELAGRGMVPQVEGLSPMESLPLVHDEAGHVAGLLAQELASRGKNIAFDGHVSDKGTLQQRLDWHKRNGYHDVQGIFVHAPVEAAVERSRARHRRGLELYRQGRGNGERLAPPEVLRAAETTPGSTVNREAFDALKHKFSAWQLWDTGGDKPKLAAADGQPRTPGIMSVEDLVKQQESR